MDWIYSPFKAHNSAVNVQHGRYICCHSFEVVIFQTEATQMDRLSGALRDIRNRMSILKKINIALKCTNTVFHDCIQVH